MGKRGLAMAREGVDPKAVEGTSHPFAPPEKVSRVTLQLIEGDSRISHLWGCGEGEGGPWMARRKVHWGGNFGKLIHPNLTLSLSFW